MRYESEIIIGVLEGLITCETLGYEDYPCEATMRRWRARPFHFPTPALFLQTRPFNLK
jgi:hypothetical protein